MRLVGRSNLEGGGTTCSNNGGSESSSNSSDEGPNSEPARHPKARHGCSQEGPSPNPSQEKGREEEKSNRGLCSLSLLVGLPPPLHLSICKPIPCYNPSIHPFFDSSCHQSFILSSLASHCLLLPLSEPFLPPPPLLLISPPFLPISVMVNSSVCLPCLYLVVVSQVYLV